MTYSFPPSLHALRDCLRGFGADVAAFKTDRQAAFMAQQLLGTRVKFPDKGKDMTAAMLRIQEACAGADTASTPAPDSNHFRFGSGSKVVPKRDGNHSAGPAQQGVQGGAQTKGNRSKSATGKSRDRHKSGRDYSGFTPETFASGLHIFCDGACEPNPGVGGWGVAAYRDGVEIHSECGGNAETTNNAMELTGLLSAIQLGRRLWGTVWAGEAIQPTTIWCDSKYCVTGVNEWMPGWKAKGWQRAGDKAEPKNRVIINLELWQAIDEALADASRCGRIAIRWVKGHIGIAGNERADKLAERGRKEAIELSSSGDELDERYRQIMEAGE